MKPTATKGQAGTYKEVSEAQRMRNRTERQINQGMIIPKGDLSCSNPKFHPHHCDCPVPESVLTFIGNRPFGREIQNSPSVTSFIPYERSYGPSPVPPLPLPPDPKPTKREEELLQKLRDASCEIGWLKSKIKTQNRTIESLENQINEARNAKKGKGERRKTTKNKRASKKAYEHGVMRIGQEDW